MTQEEQCAEIKALRWKCEHDAETYAGLRVIADDLLAALEGVTPFIDLVDFGGSIDCDKRPGPIFGEPDYSKRALAWEARRDALAAIAKAKGDE